jgi:hypothetical protein
VEGEYTCVFEQGQIELEINPFHKIGIRYSGEIHSASEKLRRGKLGFYRLAKVAWKTDQIDGKSVAQRQG